MAAEGVDELGVGVVVGYAVDGGGGGEEGGGGVAGYHRGGEGWRGGEGREEVGAQVAGGLWGDC